MGDDRDEPGRVDGARLDGDQLLLPAGRAGRAARRRRAGPRSASSAGSSSPARTTPLPRDGESSGELQCRGNWIAATYYDDPRAGESFTDDGWLRTGDVATIDERGRMRLVDRTKDLIKSGGEWISSVELENELMAPPADQGGRRHRRHRRQVGRAAAGVRRARGGRRAVRRRRSSTSSAARSPSGSSPTAVEFIDEVPKTSRRQVLQEDAPRALRRLSVSPRVGAGLAVRLLDSETLSVVLSQQWRTTHARPAAWSAPLRSAPLRSARVAARPASRSRTACSTPPGAAARSGASPRSPSTTSPPSRACRGRRSTGMFPGGKDVLFEAHAGPRAGGLLRRSCGPHVEGAESLEDLLVRTVVARHPRAARRRPPRPHAGVRARRRSLGDLTVEGLPRIIRFATAFLAPLADPFLDRADVARR